MFSLVTAPIRDETKPTVSFDLNMHAQDVPACLQHTHRHTQKRKMSLFVDRRSFHQMAVSARFPRTQHSSRYLVKNLVLKNQSGLGGTYLSGPGIEDQEVKVVFSSSCIVRPA